MVLLKLIKDQSKTSTGSMLKCIQFVIIAKLSLVGEEEELDV